MEDELDHIHGNYESQIARVKAEIQENAASFKLQTGEHKLIIQNLRAQLDDVSATLTESTTEYENMQRKLLGKSCESDDYKMKIEKLSLQVDQLSVELSQSTEQCQLMERALRERERQQEENQKEMEKLKAKLTK